MERVWKTLRVDDNLKVMISRFIEEREKFKVFPGIIPVDGSNSFLVTIRDQPRIEYKKVNNSTNGASVC